MLQRHIKDDSVDLCYIDPPFNSKRNYNQIYNNVGKEDVAQAQAFVDMWTWNDMANEGLDSILTNQYHLLPRQTIWLIDGLVKVLGKGSLMAYIVSMTNRIAQIHRVLKPTGSFYLHCDPSASHYLKIILDSLFCTQGGDFKNEVIWERTTNSGSSKGIAKRFPADHDVILFYVKRTDQFFFQSQYKEYSQKYLDHYYIYDDNDGKGRYQLQALKTVSQQRLADLKATGRLVPGKGKYPRFKDYLNDKKGVPTNDLWYDIEPVNPVGLEKLGYPTQKPEALLERIIKASSVEGDTVLDAYCGCGTTVAVAQRLNRSWVGIDITYQSISLILKRMMETHGQAAYQNITLHGVPEDFASAEALANKQDDRTRKEFEKWAVLSATNNQAIINEKKGGDGGIDGIAFTRDLTEAMSILNQEVLFSVKSNKHLSPAVVRELYGTVEREKAAMGYLITLYPMDNLVRESKQYGLYEHKATGQKLPKIQVISVEEILKGKRAILPMAAEVLKASERQGGRTDQYPLFGAS